MPHLLRSFFFTVTSPKLTLAFVVCATGCASRASVADTTTWSPSAPLANDHAAEGRLTREVAADLVADVSTDAIAAIHRSKCGACHTRVEPGTLSRGVAESAMQRHRRRAKLTEREWSNMVDYLSADGMHARATARIP